MNFHLLNPYVRYFFITDKYFCSNVNMYADDYRLFLGLSDGCNLIVENNVMPLKKGYLALIPPRTVYRLERQAQSEILIMNFDMDSSHSETDALSPTPATSLKKESEFSSLTIKPFDKFLFVDCNDLMQELLDIYTEYTHQAPYYMDIVSAKFKTFLIKLARTLKAESDLPEYLNEILSYLDKHFLENPTNSFLAKKFGFNPNYLSNIFKEHLGISLHAYLLNKKALYAKQLLVATELSVCEIAKEAGFTNQNRFCEFFKNKFGISPTQFRKSTTKFEQ